MLRKFLILCCSVAIAMPVYTTAEAGQAKSGKTAAVAKTKVKAKAKSKSRINRSKRASLRNSERIRSQKRYRQRLQRIAYQQEVDSTGPLQLASAKALIINQQTGEVLYAKGTDQPTPIASLTKLMTAMVVLDARQPMDEIVTITQADIDTLKGSGSRLRVGTSLTRGEMMQLALMSSENRAASALGHAYPGGYFAFVAAMNAKAGDLGMTRSRFAEATGLSSDNVSTAEDLAKMVKAAYQYPEIRAVSTATSYEVPVEGRRHPLEFRNTNALVRNSDWQIGLSKTGYINEAGRCLVMQAQIADQPLIIVLLDSWGKYSRIGDANRIRKWIESSNLTAQRISSS